MRTICRLNVFLFLMLFLSSSLNARPTKIYVSVDGDDNNNGSKRAPLLTVSTALKKAYQTQCNDIEILIGKGVFSIQEPLVISFDEGYVDGKKMTIRGAGMNQTVISGGVELPPFKIDKQTGLWYIQCSKIEDEIEAFNQLFVNGKRCVLARTPNQDRYIVPIEAKEKPIVNNPKSFRQDIFLKHIDVNNYNLNYANLNNCYVSILHDWDLSRRKVVAKDSVNNFVTVEGESFKRWSFFTRGGSTQLYFENAKSFLDAPGEFYYDTQNRTLYYFPREGETVTESKAIVPQSKYLLLVKGNRGSTISNLKIEELTFAYTNYEMLGTGENPEQAAASKDAAIILDNVTNVSLSGIEICHTGLYGLWFKDNCEKSKIENSYLHDLGAGGVKIGITEPIKENDPFLTSDILVDNNIICEGGRIMPTAVGVALFKASDCRILHNDIFDFYYTGVSLGWTWGFDNSPTKRNIVGFNHIHHIGWAALSDMGGIYTLGKSEGTVINNNIIHHVCSYGYDGVGIYTDEGSSDITIKNNIVYKCKSAGFSQHYGKDNIIENNIFAFNHDTQLMTAEKKDKEKNTLSFRRNIVYADMSSQIFKNDVWGGYPLFLCDQNIYWTDGTDKPMRNKSISDWTKSTGKDANSLAINPGLILKNEKDIRVTNRTAMRMISFKPIDCSKVGVQGDKNWKNLAKMDPEREQLFEQKVEENEKGEKSNRSVALLNKKEVVFILLAGLTVSGVIGGKLLMRN